MYRFTPKERAEIVTLYIENSRSVVLTQRAYRRKYRGQEAPSDNTIRRLVSNFEKHGTVGDRPHAAHQRPRRSKELIEAVRKSVAENPNESYRHRAKHFGVSGTTLRRILKDDLHLFTQYPAVYNKSNSNDDGDDGGLRMPDIDEDELSKEMAAPKKTASKSLLKRSRTKQKTKF